MLYSYEFIGRLKAINVICVSEECALNVKHELMLHSTCMLLVNKMNGLCLTLPCSEMSVPYHHFTVI